MNADKLKNRSKVRSVVVFFALYLALVLYQDPEGMAGRITALLSILLVFAFSFIEKIWYRQSIILNSERVLLLLFFLSSVFTTLLSGIPFSTISVFVIQLLLCVLLFNTNVSEKEFVMIKYIYIIAMLFCSIMTIRSCMISTRFLHGDIELFGATLDPNYIGVPIVFASVLTLGEVLIEKKFRLVGIAALFVFVVAILYTASRGNLVAFSLGNGLVLFHYLKERNTKLITKILFFFLMIVLLYMLFNSNYFDFAESAERMTTFGEDADNGRFFIWERSINAWMEHPYFGVGIGGSYFAFKQASHNTYVEILLETGLVGFVLMTVFIVCLLIRAYHYNKCLFFSFCALLLQIAFLDCLTNRCFWPYACWIAILPKTTN